MVEEPTSVSLAELSSAWAAPFAARPGESEAQIRDRRGRLVPACHTLARISAGSDRAEDRLVITARPLIGEDGYRFEPHEHPSVRAVVEQRPIRDVVMGVYLPMTRDRAWLLVSAEPVADSRGEIDRVIVTLGDIGPYKHAKEELELASRVRGLSYMAASVAHDFNNILQAISWCVESMFVEPSSPEDRELAVEICSAAERGRARRARRYRARGLQPRSQRA